VQTLQEIGERVAQRRRALGLRQLAVADKAGLTAESLSRFERGRLAELGTRKLLAVLAVLGMEIEIVAVGQSGGLDELRRERHGVRAGNDLERP
jgi:HTH-type transcriptional regulator / antitoxin HipB